MYMAPASMLLASLARNGYCGSVAPPTLGVKYRATGEIGILVFVGALVVHLLHVWQLEWKLLCKRGCQLEVV